MQWVCVYAAGRRLNVIILAQPARWATIADQRGDRMGEDSRSVGPEEEAGTQGLFAPELKEHRIRQRAYESWERESRPDGRALDHWLRAHWEIENVPERELERLEREFTPGLDKS
jgi:Protein of unknown function (DUF2934)